MSSLAISYSVLAFASLFAVFLLAQQKAFAQIHRFSAKAALLGFLMMALAAIAGTLYYGISAAWQGPHEMLANAAMFLAPPLLGVATCLGITTKSWSSAVWGRVILAVCVVYEVCRWYGIELIYRDLQVALVLVSIMYLLRAVADPKTKGLIGTSMVSYLIGALVIGTEGTLAGYLRLDLFCYLVGLGNLLLGSGLYLLFKDRHQGGDQVVA